MMPRSSFALVAAAMAMATVTAWVLPGDTTTVVRRSTISRSANCNNKHHLQQEQQQQQQLLVRPRQRPAVTVRFMAGEEVTEETTPSSSSCMSFLESTEWKTLEDLYETASKKASERSGEDGDETAFQEAAEELLPALSPALIMKLRTGEALVPPEARAETSGGELLKIFAEVSKALNTMTDRRLESARDTLQSLMNAGEIKKLDAIIGKSAREQKLDVAFFQVLQMNLRDAGEEAQKITIAGGDDDAETSDAVNRFQILQHIYTRCQEEVEKTINPGTALLNKLLRTETDSIRRNQLDHYLCPAATTITSPDGKEIVLNNGVPAKPLVNHNDFCEAIGNAVKQVRTVETSGAATPEVAADLVETIRTVAKEARIVIGDHFGGNSTEVIAFEDALYPVFRPVSPESPYIRGEQ